MILSAFSPANYVNNMSSGKAESCSSISPQNEHPAVSEEKGMVAGWSTTAFDWFVVLNIVI